MPEKISIGIDIGGTNVGFGVVDFKGNILSKYLLQTQDYNTIHDLSLAIHDTISKDYTLDTSKLRGVGIGCPVANAKTGCLHHSSNLPWKGIVPIQAAFETIFKSKVRITNDANATARGEGLFGAAKGIDNYAVITLGTGVGSGIICDGLMVEGFDGNGGEFGHIISEVEGRPCGCGRKGCLETYTSAKGIKTSAILLAKSNAFPSELSDFINQNNDIESKTVFDYAIKGDTLAIEVFRKTGAILGVAIANLVTLLGLEKIILFGGPIAAGDLLIHPIIQSFNENVIHFYQNKIKIVVSALSEKDAAILGAASLIMTK